MAVNNTLIKANPKPTMNEVVEYQAGKETVILSPDYIKKYLAGDNPNVTDSEAVMFLNLCKYQHLNPFLREAYLIKYGNRPATMVVGKDTFVKRARANKDFNGFQAGVIVIDSNGNIVEREGSFRLPTDQLIGGWAKVYIKGLSTPYYSAVNWTEYAGVDRDGNLNSMWRSKGATMIRKVALSQALREAFPDDLGGLYEPEEINTIDSELDETPIEIPSEEIPVEKPEKIEEKDVQVIEPDSEAVAASLFG
jgi:phage recombination protein Bet